MIRPVRFHAALPIVLALAILALSAAPAAGMPQSASQVTDITIRLGADVHVAADDTIGTLVAVGGPVRIDGTVSEQLVVVGETAVISGAVLGTVVIVGGRLELQAGARVGGDVVLYESRLQRAADARVGGLVREPRARWAVGPLLGLLFWVGGTLLVILAGLLFAWLAGRQLAEAAALIGRAPGPTILTAALVIIGLPILAVLSMLTVIGIPLGLTLLLLILPVLALAGQIVTGAWIGGGIIARTIPDADPAARSYGGVALGLILLQLLVLVPILGAFVMLLAPPLGAGALVYRLWRRRGDRVSTEPA